MLELAINMYKFEKIQKTVLKIKKIQNKTNKQINLNKQQSSTRTSLIERSNQSKPYNLPKLLTRRTFHVAAHEGRPSKNGSFMTRGNKRTNRGNLLPDSMTYYKAAAISCMIVVQGYINRSSEPNTEFRNRSKHMASINF